mmetsp:Transcript_8536/g.24492  ORF Transcript_8536/g.24492 Transcript_8536/m.24492 type:complete len:386 (+) Transcript_8536:192-1349(+)|eukprot:CAMPEP_0117677460 /NCGR_PEP_ID=MMETSP0804-20121206/16758_1 /TAXON_ID=1074897 /ORGANISM="Tetraselmis astigmatica, Strain CCMP880" /LENGTH=385 /DNA_ID=CAMNT_0005486747 /DNA_START=126 /DNA_END=1283 /DNA_ORIENTATION=+
MRPGAGSYGILGDLNALGGPQDYLNVSNASKKWVSAALYLCSAQVVVGLAMFLLDSMMVYDLTAKVLGQLVAAAMVVIGACGAFGSHKRSRNLLNLHIVGVILAIMLGVQYITAFSRDNYVNCSLARLYVRTKKIQGYLEKQPSVSMFSTVVSRLNEMEDMLHAVEEGSVENLQKKIDADRMMSSDQNYVKYKVQLLKSHAEKLLKHHTNVTDEDYDNLTKKERQAIEDRIDTAEEVLDRVDEHMEDGELISYEEYTDLLHSLEEVYREIGDVSHRTITDHIKQLSFDKDVFKRHEKGYKDSSSEDRRRQRHERQIEWSNRLQDAMKEHAFTGSHPDLSDLPQWCMQDRSYNTALSTLGSFLVLLQLASGFCVLSLAFHLPVKAE